MASPVVLTIPRIDTARSPTPAEILASPALKEWTDQPLPTGIARVLAGPVGAGRQVDGFLWVRKTGVIFLPRAAPTGRRLVAEAANVTLSAATGFLAGLTGDAGELLGIHGADVTPFRFGNRPADENWKLMVNHPSHFVFAWVDQVALRWQPNTWREQAVAVFDIEDETAAKHSYAINGMSLRSAAAFLTHRAAADLEVAASTLQIRHQSELLLARMAAAGRRQEEFAGQSRAAIDAQLGGGTEAETLAWWNGLAMSDRIASCVGQLSEFLPRYRAIFKAAGATPEWLPADPHEAVPEVH